MIRHWLAGAAAFAMMTGVALAQGSSSDTFSTQSTTSTPAPAMGDYSSSKDQKTIDSSGTETDKSQSYSSGSSGSNANSSSRITAPDGSQMSISHDRQTNSPLGDATTTNHTSTTTIDH